MISYDIVMETELKAKGLPAGRKEKKESFFFQPHLLTPGPEGGKLAYVLVC